MWLAMIGVKTLLGVHKGLAVASSGLFSLEQKGLAHIERDIERKATKLESRLPSEELAPKDA